MRKLLSLLTALLFVGSMWGAIAAGDYELVTSASDLVAGAHYIITSGTSGTVYCISNVANTNNRKTVSVTVDANGKITVGSSSTIMTFTLGGSTGVWTFATDNYAGTDGYLTAGNTNNKNYLTITDGGTDDKQKWAITFSGTTPKLQAGAGVSPYLRYNYNNGTPLFSGYASGTSQADVYLFKAAPAGPALSSIAVKTAPTKTTYTEGEYFDPTGLVITRTYSDASKSDWAYDGHETDFSFSPSITTALTTENTSVTITYGGKSTTQPISVTGCTSSITISKGTPENGTFDITGTGDVCIDGGNASVTISDIEPEDGYRFKEITSSASTGGGTIDNNAKTVTNISASTTINVVFEPIPEVHAESNNTEWGTVSVESDGTTITATPAECYRVKSGDEGYSITDGSATVTHTGNSNTLTVNPATECTIQVIFEKNVNIYKDNIQGTDEFEDCDTKAPKLTDKTVATTGTCAQLHYHFVGWVAEANISNLTAENVKAGGANIVVDGTTYYAVWAKKESGDVYTISINGAGLQAVVSSISSGYSAKHFDVEDYDFYASAVTKSTQSNTSNWFQLKKNNDYILIPELPGRITNISSTAIRNANNGTVSTGVYFNNSATTSKAIASETLSNATSFSLDIEGNATSGYLLFGAATCINQLSVSYSTIEYTDSIAVCCKEAITIDSEIANGSVEADKEEACAGDVITLTATPASNNYRFGSWNVKDADEGDVTVTNNKFEMPAKAVTVSATFTEKADAGLTWKIGEDEVDEATVTYGGSSNIYPTLYNPHSLSTGITYSSLEGDVASFADPLVYEITLNAVGETIITASFAGNEDYKSQEVSYYLTVTDKATGIEDVDSSVKPVKVLKNGLLLIEKNGKTYNAQGQLVK